MCVCLVLCFFLKARIMRLIDIEISRCLDRFAFHLLGKVSVTSLET